MAKSFPSLRARHPLLEKSSPAFRLLGGKPAASAQTQPPKPGFSFMPRGTRPVRCAIRKAHAVETPRSLWGAIFFYLRPRPVSFARESHVNNFQYPCWEGRDSVQIR
jgi:hypothetical protein